FLHREIEIVDARIPDIREVARRIAKCLLRVGRSGWSGQPRRRAVAREIECAGVKPVLYSLIEARRKRVADHHGTIRQSVRGSAISIIVVQDTERRPAAYRVDGARTPAAEHLPGDTPVEPSLPRTERKFHDRSDRQPNGD